MAANDWYAQYYTANNTFVGDDLFFDGTGLVFEQNTTALPFQSCQSNWIDWRGEYEVTNPTTLRLSYMRCTQNATGCLSCQPTHQETVGFEFSDDCAMLTLAYSDGSERVYFPLKKELNLQ